MKDVRWSDCKAAAEIYEGMLTNCKELKQLYSKWTETPPKTLSLQKSSKGLTVIMEAAVFYLTETWMHDQETTFHRKFLDVLLKIWQ